MKKKLILLILGFLPLLTFADGPLPSKAVLITDSNHDGQISEITIKNGQDLILVKRNPAVLSPDAMVLQTKGYNLYASASLSDLKEPGASKNLWFAKVQANGTIKVYTLANLGYSGIQIAKDAQGNDAIFLVTQKGTLDKVIPINYPTIPMRQYQPELQKTKNIQR